MKKLRLRRSVFNLAAPAALAAVLAVIVVSCSQQSESPVAPSGVRGGSFNTEIEPTPTPEPTPEPTPPPPPPPVGNCSPGFWKNHPDDFEDSCQEAADLPGDEFTTCGDLLVAITCNGGPQTGCTGPRRQAAATALNTVSGCTESD